MPTTFNTTDPKPGYVYDSAVDTWFPLLGIAPGSSVVRWRKTVSGGETSVSGLDDLGATLSYNTGTEQVYLNGVLLVRTEDYTATNGTSVTALNALAASDVIEVISFNATNVQVTDALLRTDINAKGDLIVGAAVDTAAILASGTNGQVLRVNTATTSGLEWGTLNADIEGVTAGTGLTGGGTSGTVTLALDSAAVIAPTIVDAKGDILTATADNTPARLAVGANDTVLTADSTTATGLKWATPASGAYTTLASGTLSGTAVNLTSISQTYRDLVLVISNPFVNVGTSLSLRCNSYSTADHFFHGLNYNSAAVENSVGQTLFRTDVSLPTTSSNWYNYYEFPDYTKAIGGKNILGVMRNPSFTPTTGFKRQFFGNLDTAAITSINILTENGTSTFSGGTYILYGVK